MKLGILGGGQLARMMSLSAHAMGIETRCIEPSLGCPAGQLTSVRAYSYDDVSSIEKYFEGVDAITYEFENINLETVRTLSEKFTVRPSVQALEVTSNRIREKNFCKSIGVPVPRFIGASSIKDLISLRVDKLFFPSILKRTSGGYDGKGQWRLNSISDLEPIALAEGNFEVILEDFISFDTEYSCVAVRDVNGKISYYDICENTHESGILKETLSPPRHISASTETMLKDYTKQIMEALNYVGVIAVEYFVKGDAVYFNEFAPRVHNTAHWTIEGAECSQFENHVRACLDLPIGGTRNKGKSFMCNLLGKKGDIKKILAENTAHYHWYGKADVSGRRKVGHVTSVHSTNEEREAALVRMRKLVL